MPQAEQLSVAIRLARLEDIPQIAELIRPFVEQRLLLPRSYDDLRDLVRNGFVADARGMIVGFAAVEIYSKKLAELQCLAVSATCHGQGIGKRLVQACIECARQHQVLELMAITALDSFFQDSGFDYTLPDQKRALFINTRPGVRELTKPGETPTRL